MGDEERPLLEHLGELRKRIILCLVSVAIGMIISYSLYDFIILDLIRGPIDFLNGREDNPFAIWSPLLGLFKTFRTELGNPEFALHYIGPSEAFSVKLKLSLACGVIVALPFILFQGWKFIAVGLKKKERRIIAIFFPISLILFLVGILFAYLITVPVGLYFLINVSRGLIPMFTISKYASLVLMLIFVFGLIFELPLVIIFLTRIGLVTPKSLARNRKYAILLMFVIAALLTPPDIFTQFLLALPVIILYEVSIWISKIIEHRSKQ